MLDNEFKKEFGITISFDDKDEQKFDKVMKDYNKYL